MSAVGFIYLIILGNIWYAMLVVGTMPPEWLKVSFYLGIFFILGCGVGLVTRIALNWRSMKDETNEPEDFPRDDG